MDVKRHTIWNANLYYDLSAKLFHLYNSVIHKATGQKSVV